MGAGKYRHRITIRNAPTDASRDSFGGRTGVGTTQATVWAKRVEIGSAEYVSGEKESAQNRAEFVIRYRTDITEAREVIDAVGKVFDIVGVLDRKGTLKETQLNCVLRNK